MISHECTSTNLGGTSLDDALRRSGDETGGGTSGRKGDGDGIGREVDSGARQATRPAGGSARGSAKQPGLRRTSAAGDRRPAPNGGETSRRACERDEGRLGETGRPSRDAEFSAFDGRHYPSFDLARGEPPETRTDRRGLLHGPRRRVRPHLGRANLEPRKDRGHELSSSRSRVRTRERRRRSGSGSASGTRGTWRISKGTRP